MALAAKDCQFLSTPPGCLSLLFPSNQAELHAVNKGKLQSEFKSDFSMLSTPKYFTDLIAGKPQHCNNLRSV